MNKKAIWACLVAWWAVCAVMCAKSTPARDESAANEGKKMFPAPFTAEQIRMATKAGRTYRYKVEEKGKAVSYRTIEFKSVSSDRAEMVVRHTTETGGDIEPPKAGNATWRELQSHAEFPEGTVTRDEKQITLPSGSLVAIVYTVGDDKSREVFCFDPARPGAPVLFWHEENGERIIVTTLVDYKG
jgi:hypothetical protein